MLFLPAVRLVDLCLPHLEASEAGRIVAITSLAAQGADRPPRALERDPPRADRLAEDAGPRARPEGHHRELRRARPDRDRAPRRALPDGPSEADLAEIPLRRWGDPREFGDVVCFLASDRARYVTGQTVVVDGGLQRALF